MADNRFKNMAMLLGKGKDVTDITAFLVVCATLEEQLNQEQTKQNEQTENGKDRAVLSQVVQQSNCQKRR